MRHALLLVLTFFTLSISGALVWTATGAEPESWSELLNPVTVLRTVLSGATYALAVLIILGCHEMGHFLACRYHGIPSTLPFFIPGPPPVGTFGALIRIRGRIPDRRALFDVAAAGPLAGFAATLPVLALAVLRAEPVIGGGGVQLGEPLLMTLALGPLPGNADFAVDSLIGASWVGLLVTSLNLFPVGQLDGGHAAYAISRRFHYVVVRLTLLGLLGHMLVQAVVYHRFPFYLVWFAILLWMRDRHPPLLDESSPLGTGRKLVAVLLLAIFVVSFIAVPIYPGE